MADLKRVLFVCTGNTCRSSMAEAVFKKLLKDNNIDDIEVSSAGIAVFYSSGASNHAVEVMKIKGIDLSAHRSRQVTQEMVDSADIILTMTVSHKERLLQLCPYAADKIFTLKEFAYTETNNHNLDIVDPFGGDLNCYKESSAEIDKCLEKILQMIREN